MADEVKITVIATGFNSDAEKKEEPIVAPVLNVKPETVRRDDNVPPLLREMEDAKNKKPSFKEKLFGRSEKSIHEFVETSFSLDYKDKCWWMD